MTQKNYDRSGFSEIMKKQSADEFMFCGKSKAGSCS